MKNQDRYKTSQERAEAFMEYNRSKTTVPLWLAKRVLKWLELEAEDEKPLPCPFCGGEASVNNCVGGWCVQCDCGYVSKQFNEGDDDEVLKREAIDAHNRVAKKCMEGK